jgi:carbon monoxide dehydrogenase subunit G
VQYETTTAISASPERVWTVLADVERWPEWTSSVSKVEKLDAGELAVGTRVRIKQPGMPRLTWRVIQLEPGRGFSWTTRSPGATTVASHSVDAQGDGTVIARASLQQTGPLSGVVNRLFGKRSRRYADTEAAGLKRRSEEG